MQLTYDYLSLARHRTESPPLPLFLPSNSPLVDETPAVGTKRKRALSISTIVPSPGSASNSKSDPTTLVFETPVKSRPGQKPAPRRMSLSSLSSLDDDDDDDSPDRLLLGMGGDSPSPADVRKIGALGFGLGATNGGSQILVEDTPMKPRKPEFGCS